ncbi:hypothetical protein P154DRAFT_534883 [Amniculicola lignicola CBS 123094]|uniref:Uncharacterized protein n=1 Tax=Amniculicola lignicola CBS 123094 TaxID=1392246 RepID=A0A6A5WFL6_9PLEO|nr:hypothetical protein P154DRAFT_534883 [Amniculicola lignicola CBS 123094]
MASSSTAFFGTPLPLDEDWVPMLRDEAWTPGNLGRYFDQVPSTPWLDVELNPWAGVDSPTAEVHPSTEAENAIDIPSITERCVDLSRATEDTRVFGVDGASMTNEPRVEQAEGVDVEGAVIPAQELPSATINSNATDVSRPQIDCPIQPLDCNAVNVTPSFEQTYAAGTVPKSHKDSRGCSRDEADSTILVPCSDATAEVDVDSSSGSRPDVVKKLNHGLMEGNGSVEMDDDCILLSEALLPFSRINPSLEPDTTYSPETTSNGATGATFDAMEVDSHVKIDDDCIMLNCVDIDESKPHPAWSIGRGNPMKTRN